MQERYYGFVECVDRLPDGKASAWIQLISEENLGRLQEDGADVDQIFANIPTPALLVEGESWALFCKQGGSARPVSVGRWVRFARSDEDGINAILFSDSRDPNPKPCTVGDISFISGRSREGRVLKTIFSLD